LKEDWLPVFHAARISTFNTNKHLWQNLSIATILLLQIHTKYFCIKNFCAVIQILMTTMHEHESADKLSL